MKPTSTVALAFDPALALPQAHKRLRDGLSAVLQIEDSLWLANDESASLERLTLAESGTAAAAHRQFQLHKFLDLPHGAQGKPPRAPEIDIEGLDHDGGYLWLTGSHSLKREKPDAGEGAKAGHKALTRVSAEANRYLLARIPLARGPDGLVPVRRLRVPGDTLAAGRLGSGNRARGNPLVELLRTDKHFGPSMRLPGKDNGFDVEGLAVSGDRVFLGLRGPVLRGWAAILELRVEGDSESGQLRLRAVAGTKGRRLRKHFLDLGGRGIRDLYRDGEDLLILAGPTMDLDGTIALFRWPGALQAAGPSLVAAAGLQHLLDLPNGAGCDRAEGIALFRAAAGQATAQVLVVYDAAAPARQTGPDSVLADVFDLPVRSAPT
jgi:hypothetical protein